MRSGSDFWARGHHTESSSEFTAALASSADPSSPMPTRLVGLSARRRARARRSPASDSDSSDSADTEIADRPAPGGGSGSGAAQAKDAAAAAAGVVDEIGAQDAFAAGMMFALSRRLVPGAPYTPAAGASREGAEADRDRDRGRWRLEECLRCVCLFPSLGEWRLDWNMSRFATELAGRKARRKGWDGLAEAMVQAGWFEA